MINKILDRCQTAATVEELKSLVENWAGRRGSSGAPYAISELLDACVHQDTNLFNRILAALYVSSSDNTVHALLLNLAQRNWADGDYTSLARALSFSAASANQSTRQLTRSVIAALPQKCSIPFEHAEEVLLQLSTQAVHLAPEFLAAFSHYRPTQIQQMTNLVGLSWDNPHVLWRRIAVQSHNFKDISKINPTCTQKMSLDQFLNTLATDPMADHRIRLNLLNALVNPLKYGQFLIDEQNTLVSLFSHSALTPKWFVVSQHPDLTQQMKTWLERSRLEYEIEQSPHVQRAPRKI